MPFRKPSGGSGTVPTAITVDRSAATGQFTVGAGIANSVGFASTNAPAQMDSVSITAGTWVVTGIMSAGAAGLGAQAAISATTANMTPIATTQVNGALGATEGPQVLSCVVTVGVTTTVFLNAQCVTSAGGSLQGGIMATRIQ